MSTADILALGQDAVILAGIIAGYRLLKQGGGVQVKPVTAPATSTAKKKAGTPPEPAAGETVPLDEATRHG